MGARFQDLSGYHEGWIAHAIRKVALIDARVVVVTVIEEQFSRVLEVIDVL